MLGDLVNYGPMPAEVVDFVRSHSDVVIRGNHDNAVGFDLDPRCTPRYADMADTTMQYSKANLDGDATAFLRDLPLTRVLERRRSQLPPLPRNAFQSALWVLP